MEEDPKNILWEVLASEDASGCSEDLTVVTAAPIRRLRRHLQDRAANHQDGLLRCRHQWFLEKSVDGLIHLTLSQSMARLVASSLELVNPDSARQLCNARVLATMIQNLCEDL